MKSVKTMGPGFTPPPEYFHASPSPETVKKFKGKGKSKGQLRKSGHSPDKAIQLDDSDDNDAGDTYHPHIEEEGLPPPLGNPFAKQNSQVPQHGVGSSNSALYARKKLPTTQQLLYGSSRPDILPRHKIPTKPQGRSPALNRARRERRQAYVLASRTDRHGFGGGIGETVPGESSANDDDEDMFYKTDYLNQKGIGDGSSSRALRSAQRQVRVAKRTRSLRSNGHHSHRPLDLDGDFIPSTSDALRSGSQAAAPSRGRPRKDFRTSIHPHIALKMSLTQAGLSPEQMAFMKRGGYATVRDLTREGLACTFGDFTVFSSWLDDLSIPANCNRDVQSARQVVRSRVRTVAEEVRVRSTIVWEAAGMMEEGSDVADDYATSRTQMGHSPINGTQSSHDKYRLEHAMHTDDEDDAQVFRSSQRSPIKKRKSKASYYEANDAPPDPLSDSSGIEFLGVRQ